MNNATKPTERRNWTDRELRYLTKHFSQISSRKIAKALCRSIRSVRCEAARRGLCPPRDRAKWERVLEAVREIHGKTRPGEDVAAMIGCSRKTLERYRKKLNLPKLPRDTRYLSDEKWLAGRQRCIQSQLDKTGLRSLSELKQAKRREFASQSGWPEHLSLVALLIVEALYMRGPMTKRGIADAIGRTWRGAEGTFRNPKVPGGCYMSEVQRAGLVVRLDKAVQGPVRGKPVSLYFIGLGVEPCQSKRP